MPRTQLVISRFDKGMVCNADSSDYAQDTAYYTADQSMDGNEGQLIARYDDTDLTSTKGAVGYACGYGWITKNDGKNTLVYYDYTDGKVKYIANFYGTPGAVTDLSAAMLNSGGTGRFYFQFIPNNATLRFSVGIYTSGNASPGSTDIPQWCGYTANVVFGSSSSSLLLYDQECKNYYDNAGTPADGTFHFPGTTPALGTANDGGYFRDGKRYYWAYALEYDGYQISPLSSYTSYAPGGNYLDFSVQILAKSGHSSPSSFNKRITAVVLFRAESDDGYSDTPQTLFRYVDKIDLLDATWTTATNDKTYTFSDTGNEGLTYEAYSGLSETATTSIVNWGIATIVDKWMFVGNCYHADIEEAPTIIFRSVAGRYDVFNIQTDIPEFVRLPRIPTALAQFNGRLIAFDTNTMYIINPDTLGFEQIIHGYGVNGPQAVITTPNGLVFANKQSVYLYDGTSIKSISYPIEQWSEGVSIAALSGLTTSAYASYRKAVENDDGNTRTDAKNVRIKLGYIPKTQQVLVACESDSSVITVPQFAYSIAKNAWTIFYFPATMTVEGGFELIAGLQSELMLAYRGAGPANKLYSLCTATTRKKVSWLSQRINLNHDITQYQNIYFIRLKAKYATTYPTVSYGVDTDTVSHTPSSEAVDSTYRRNKYIRFSIDGVSNGDYINQVSVIGRVLIGAR